MSVVVITTISCNAVILRCARCQLEVAATAAISGSTCQVCGDTLLLDRHCAAGFSLKRGGVLIRCVAENKDGWRCEDHGGRDFCPVHTHLADPASVARPTPQGIGDDA